MAADAVKYSQGEQLVATSEKNKFSITALSSQKTAIPANLVWGTGSNPLMPAALAALFCIVSLFAYRISFSAENDPLSIWGLVTSIIIPLVVFIGTGFYLLILKTNEAYKDMGY